jgi:hypothetical protein
MKPRGLGVFEKQMILRRVINASQRITLLLSPAKPDFVRICRWLMDEQIQIEGWTVARFSAMIRQVINGNQFTTPQYFGLEDEQNADY